MSARSTNNLILAANIKVTQDWWNSRRRSFVLYASEVVLDEAAKEDIEIAAQRLSLLQRLSSSPKILAFLGKCSYSKLLANFSTFDFSHLHSHNLSSLIAALHPTLLTFIAKQKTAVTYKLQQFESLF